MNKNYEPQRPKRMWINQPSKLQPNHEHHGKNVLAVLERPADKKNPFHPIPPTYRVYFLEGPVISMEVYSFELSEGWRA